MNKLALLLLPLLVAGPAFAGGPVVRGQRNVYHEEYCYKNVEKYTPGYYNEYGTYFRGRVRVRRERVPCERNRGPIYMPQSTPDSFPRYEDAHPNMGRVDDNSCAEGTVAGGLLGGALGGVLSKKENWIWAIPTGIVGGAMVGCQVDGG